MELREVTDKNTWEQFFQATEDKTFLQSWQWGEFWQSMGNKVWRMGVYEGKHLSVAALVVKVTARRGTFLLIQHGPVLAVPEQSISKALQFFTAELKKLGKKERADFIRIAPVLKRTEEHEAAFKNLGFRQSLMHANAYEATWKLDITLPEEELLSRMRKTTRYVVKQTLQNQDIEIVTSDRAQDIDVYAKLNEAVAKRQQFVPFSKEFIQNEFKALEKDGNALWIFGKYKGEIAAGALVVFWSGIGFYHQAGSLSQYAKFSIPYRVQWEAIVEAKRRGCVLYDFWGYVNPDEQPEHPWAGPTRFKMGFGGNATEYVKTQDYPLSVKYWLVALFEWYRKVKRHL